MSLDLDLELCCSIAYMVSLLYDLQKLRNPRVDKTDDSCYRLDLCLYVPIDCVDLSYTKSNTQLFTWHMVLRSLAELVIVFKAKEPIGELA